jgi:hypothetical protein
MTPSVLLAIPAVASAIGLPLLEAPQSPDLATAIQQFATETAAALSSVNAAALEIARVAYVTCLLVGVLLYFTHIGRRRLGKDLVVGGALLLVITEYVIPSVTALAK